MNYSRCQHGKCKKKATCYIVKQEKCMGELRQNIRNDHAICLCQICYNMNYSEQAEALVSSEGIVVILQVIQQSLKYIKQFI